MADLPLSPKARPWIARVEALRAEIDPRCLDTPTVRREALDRQVGGRLVLKNECLGPVRSFKARGTEALFCRRSFDGPVVCASAGNFGQGVAWSASRRGVKVVVFAPEGASSLKVRRMKDLGATVHLRGRDLDAAKGIARSAAANHGWTFIEDGREEELFLGTATLAQELEAESRDAEVFLCPVGNGALFGGMAAWFRAKDLPAERIGVVAKRAPSMRASFLAGSPVSTTDATTVADGIAIREPVAEGVAWVNAFADDVVEVSEEALAQAVSLLVETTGLVVEPAGAAGVAALFEYPKRWAGKTITTVLCGGNLDARTLAGLLRPTTSNRERSLRSA